MAPSLEDEAVEPAFLQRILKEVVADPERQVVPLLRATWVGGGLSFRKVSR